MLQTVPMKYLTYLLFTCLTFNLNATEIQPIYFDFASAQLDQNNLEQIEQLSNSLGNHSITLEGHTDFMGNDVANIQLSKARIQSVQTALMNAGFPSILIDNILPKGETEATSFSESTDVNKIDRRVDIIMKEHQFENLDELHALCAQKSLQTFTLSSGTAANFKTKSGHKISIDKNAFASLTHGTPLQMEVQETTDLASIFAHKLSTITDNGQILETAGMLEVNFTTLDGQPVELDNQTNALAIEMQGNTDENDFELFNGTTENNGVTTWQATDQGLSKNNSKEKFKYSLENLFDANTKFDIKYTKLIVPEQIKLEMPMKPSLMRKPFKPSKPNYTKMKLNGKTMSELKSEKKKAALQNYIDKKKASYEQRLANYEAKMIKYAEAKAQYESDILCYQEAVLETKKRNEEYREMYLKEFEEYSLQYHNFILERCLKQLHDEIQKGRFKNMETYHHPRHTLKQILNGYARKRIKYKTKKNTTYKYHIDQQAFNLLLDKYDISDNLAEIELYAYEHSISPENVEAFIFQSNIGGWFNVDRYYKMEPDMVAKLDVATQQQHNVYVKVAEDNVFVALNNYDKTEAVFKSPRLPKNKVIQVITLDVQDGVLLMDKTDIRLSNQKHHKVNLQPTNLKEVILAMNSLS